MRSVKETRNILDKLSVKGTNPFNITPNQTGGMSRTELMSLLNGKMQTSFLQLSNIPITKKNITITVGGDTLKIAGVSHVLHYGTKYPFNDLVMDLSTLPDGRYINQIHIVNNEAVLKIRPNNQTTVDEATINQEILGSFIGFMMKDKKVSEINYIRENVTYYGNFPITEYTDNTLQSYMVVSNDKGEI